VNFVIKKSVYCPYKCKCGLERLCTVTRDDSRVSDRYPECHEYTYDFKKGIKNNPYITSKKIKKFLIYLLFK
jgi:hypothetical protein